MEYRSLVQVAGVIEEMGVNRQTRRSNAEYVRFEELLPSTNT